MDKDRSTSKYWASQVLNTYRKLDKGDFRIKLLCGFFEIPVTGLAEYLDRSTSVVCYYRSGKTPVPEDVSKRLDKLLEVISNTISDTKVESGGVRNPWYMASEMLTGAALDAT